LRQTPRLEVDMPAWLRRRKPRRPRLELDPGAVDDAGATERGGYRLTLEGGQLLAALAPLDAWAQGWATDRG
jgi:hypothetical protein